MFNINKMIMTTNDVLAKQNFITKVNFKDGDNELSKDLKIKIIAMRIEYAKVRKRFDEDLQEFVKSVTPDNFNSLQQKPNRTEAEEKELQDIINKINGEYSAYVSTRGKDEETVNHTSLTEEEFNEILEVNSGNDVEINGNKLSAADFLEILYSLFVEV